MTHPQNNHVQVSVFGPGYGESILIHLGNKQWVIVDSCKNKGKKQPAAIEYLNQIGANVEEEVKVVVATHWDEDHIQGLSQIIDVCRSAKFALPAVFTSKDIIHFLSSNEIQPNSAIRSNELLSCVRNLENRRVVSNFAMQNRIIWEQEANQASHNKHIEIRALSPSDQQLQDFITKIAKKNFDADHTTKKRLPSEVRNKTSIALLITIGEFSILLGSDVMATGKNSGWKNIIHLLKDKSLKSRVYKVAHHGSSNADLNEIWTELLEKPYSIVTPFSKSNLPKSSDIQRIKERSFKSYITSRKVITNPTKFERFHKKYEKTNQLWSAEPIQNCEPISLVIDVQSGEIVSVDLGNCAREF